MNIFRIKPGRQHIKLKQELEEIIAEQRSLEWAKRLEEEKQKQLEDKGEASDEDHLEKIEAKLAEETEVNDNIENPESESDTEEELIEDDIEMRDVSRKNRNPLIADEAEESDYEDSDVKKDINTDSVKEVDNELDDNDSEESSDADDESSDTDDEQVNDGKQKKGRILRAFEDSDEEDTSSKIDNYLMKSDETRHDRDNLLQGN